ncbi:MAG: hypothetical protein Tsb004_08160 [Allomuricauda sp.]
MTYKEVQNGTQKNQKKESPIPPTVKEITGQDYEYILNFGVVFKDKPITQKDNGKKYQKFNGIEQHILLG